MDLMLFVTAVGTLGGLTVVLAILLVLANRKLHVPEDPRIDVVEDLLPHANCGACEFPGCRPFAEALVKKQAEPAKCTVSDEDGRMRIAGFLGVEMGAVKKRVARLACAGGTNVSRVHASYRGHGTCRGAGLVAGGGKGCVWGCLGFGDCAEVCDFDAILMDRFELPVVDEDRCTACNDCVEVCPKDLFSLQPVEHRLWVACKSREEGDRVLAECEVGCTACARCAMDAPGDLITMKNNLPVVDYDQDHQTRAPIRRCPTGAIVWLDPERGPVKGEASPVILRTTALPAVSTWDGTRTKD